MTLRADAQRNLDRLLGVAAECFAERGLDVSVDEIARRAGVGHGTVFRRFATKDELVAAVLHRQLTVMTERALEALADEDPWAGFERFMRAAARAYAENRALVAGLDRCTAEKDELMSAVKKLVRRARGAGVLRAGLSAEDVMTLVPVAAQYPEVVLDGLRAR